MNVESDLAENASSETASAEPADTAAAPVDAAVPQQAASAPAATPEAKPEQPNLPFVEGLRKLLPSHEFESGVRMTKQGLFVEDRLVPQILDAYQRWLQSASDRPEKRSEDKIRRKLFGTDQNPTLYYLLDGKRCLPGFILAGSIGDAQKLRITPYQANLQDTKDSLHPRDPLLATQDRVRARLSPQEGFSLEFEAGAQRFTLDESGLRGVVRNLRAEPGYLKEHPELAGPLRETLGTVAEFFARLKPVDQSQRLLVPDRLKQQGETRLFRYRSFICLVEASGRVTGMYEVKGKGFGRFLRDEIAALAQPDGTNLIRGFDSKASKIQYLGKLWTHGMSFHLHLRAYRLFEREVQRSEAGPGKVPVRYSVRDVLDRLVQSFGRAQPVEELTILELLGKRRQPFAKYRRAKGWIFIVTDKNVLFSCIRIPGEPLEAPRRNDGPRKDGKNDRRGGKPGRNGPGKPRGKGRNDRRDGKGRGERREGGGGAPGDRRGDGGPGERRDRRPPRGAGRPGGRPGGGPGAGRGGARS